jgi:hypothetical protein
VRLAKGTPVRVVVPDAGDPSGDPGTASDKPATDGD